MDTPTASLRCVGCRSDLPFTSNEGSCPNCSHPIADSVRRWKRFVDRDEGSVRGALLMLALAGCFSLPFVIASTIASGFVDPVAAQKESLAVFSHPSILVSMFAGCITMVAAVAAIIACLVLMIFSVRGVTFRVVAPLATMAIASVVILFIGFAATITIAMNYLRDQETGQRLTTIATIVYMSAVSVVNYACLAWMIDALWRSVGTRVPLRPLLWIVAITFIPLTAVTSALAVSETGPMIESVSGIARLVVSLAALVVFSCLVIYSSFKVRRILGELADRHRGLNLGSDPLAKHRNAPPTFTQLE